MVQYLTDFIPFRPMEPSKKKQKNVQMQVKMNVIVKCIFTYFFIVVKSKFFDQFMYIIIDIS